MTEKRRIPIKAAALFTAIVMLFTGCGTNSDYAAVPGIESKIIYTEQSGHSESTSYGSDEFVNSESKEDLTQKGSGAEEILSAMTLEQKIAQMLFLSVTVWKLSGDQGKNVTELNPEITGMIQKYGFGGIILFSQNITDAEQTVKLTYFLQEANHAGGNRAKLFVGVDQEGGSVTRLATGTQLCGNMALGACGKENVIRQAADLIGEELHVLGINLDFAPVLDVNSNPKNPIIGIRSFSDDAQKAAKLGNAFMEGLKDRNVISALKHFPGHGDTQTDSHTGLPLIDKSKDELERTELVPFQECINNGAELVMTAHIQYPQIESQTYISRKTGEEIFLPATLSEAIITGILREELGFGGVVITDAMNMDAVAQHFDPLDAAKFAINAGVDMILMPVNLSSKENQSDLETYIRGIADMVNREEISQVRIDEAVRRILSLKAKYSLLETEMTKEKESDLAACIRTAKEITGSGEHHAREWEITGKTITLLKNENNLLPLKGSENILIACPYESEILSVKYGLQKLEEKGILKGDEEIRIVCYDGKNAKEAESFLGTAQVVIAVSALYKESELNPSLSDGAESAFLDALLEAVHKKGGSFIQISAQLPYDLARYPDAEAVLAVYLAKGMSELPGDFSGDTLQYAPNLSVGIFTVFGGNEPAGKLPVNVYRLSGDYTYSEEILFPRGFGIGYGDSL